MYSLIEQYYDNAFISRDGLKRAEFDDWYNEYKVQCLIEGVGIVGAPIGQSQPQPPPHPPPKKTAVFI